MYLGMYTMSRATHMLGKTREGSKLSTLKNFETLHKQEVRLRQSCKPPGLVLKECSICTQRPSSNTGRFIGSRHLRKSLSCD